MADKDKGIGLKKRVPPAVCAPVPGYTSTSTLALVKTRTGHPVMLPSLRNLACVRIAKGPTLTFCCLDKMVTKNTVGKWERVCLTYTF